MLKGITITLLAGSLLVLGALAAACSSDSDSGGGDVLSLDEYFERLGELDAQFEERTDQLDEELNEDLDGVEDFEEGQDIFVQFFEDGLDAIGDFLEGLEGLNPPSEVEAEHNAAVSAGKGTVDAFDGLLDLVRDAESEADFFALEEDSAFLEAGAAFDEACFALQDIADENDIELDLDCEDIE